MNRGTFIWGPSIHPTHQFTIQWMQIQSTQHRWHVKPMWISFASWEPKTQWIKTTVTYSLQVLGDYGLRSASVGQNQIVSRPWRENQVLASSSSWGHIKEALTSCRLIFYVCVKSSSAFLLKWYVWEHS